MAINFPNNPTLNQTYSNGTTTWKWNGSVWELSQNNEVSFNRIVANDADIVDLTVTNSVNGIGISKLDDIALSTLQNNQVLVYNSSVEKWVNSPSFNGGTITNALTVQNTLAVTSTSSFDSNLTIRNGSEIRLNNTVNSAYVGLSAPPNPSANKIYTLPVSDGSAGQVLRTDGTGKLSWVSVISPSGLTPAQGPEGAIQFNDGTEFAGVAELTYDGDLNRLTVPRLTATGTLTVTNVTESTASNVGSIVTAGGIGIGKNLRVASTINSTSPTTGSVIVSGGVGIARNLYVGENVDVSGEPTATTHLTNKQYVDNRITAFAVAFGA